MIDELTGTFVVNAHPHGRPVMVGREYRCSQCRHRLGINGRTPQSSRSRPMGTWPRELLDRYRARPLFR